MSPTRTISIKDSITTQLLMVVFSIYLFIAIAVTLIHMAAEYHNMRESVMEDLKVFQETFEPGLKESIWNFNDEQIQKTLKGMLNVPVIVGVMVENMEDISRKGAGFVLDPEGKILSIDCEGNPVSVANGFSKLLAYTFTITYPRENGEQSIIADVTIYSSTGIVFQKVQRGFLFILVNALIKTAALWVIFLWIGQRVLSRPLAILTEAAKQLTQDEMREPPHIDVQTRGRNELKILQDAFNSMVKKLFLAREGLKESLHHLEEAHRRMALLLEGSRNVTAAHDKFTILIEAINSILSCLPCKESGRISLSFQEESKHSGYAHFQMPVKRNPEGKLRVKDDRIQDITHFLSDTAFVLRKPESSLLPGVSSLVEETLTVPLWHNGLLIGSIEIEGIHEEAFTKAENNFVETLTQSVAITLEDIQFNYQLRKAQHELEKINQNLEMLMTQRTRELQDSLQHLRTNEEQLKTIDEIVMFINQETNFNVVLSRILGTLSRLIPSVQRAFCVLYEPERKTWVIRKWFSMRSNDFQQKERDDEWVTLFFQHVAHYVGWAMITKGENIARWNMYADSALPKAVLTIPIALDEKVVAFFHFDNQEDEEAFDPETLKVLGNLSEHITSAFIRTRDHKALQEQEARLRETFEKYKQSQSKLAWIGEMTGGIVHDFKNPLGAIQGFVELLQLGMVSEEESSCYLEKIHDEATRISDMVHELLDFARGSMSLSLETCAVGKFMEEMRRFLGNYIVGNVEIILEPCEADRFPFDPGKLRRVIYNLVTNAQDAMPEGGVIRLSCEQKEDCVEIRVSDNGPGIPEAIRDNLFDTFVTHGKKKGSGMGTAIAKTIVEAHGGHISFTTETGKGTTFIIQLPIR